MNLNDIRKEIENFEDIFIDLLNKRINFSKTEIINDNEIFKKYNELIMPFFDKNEYCSVDLEILNNIEKRILLGNKVIECKYLQNKELFDKLIYETDIENALRNIVIEKQILTRVMDKAKKKGLNYEIIFVLYNDILIPMTIEQEIKHLKYIRNI